MPENAFMMAWNDFKCFPQINRSSGEYIIEIEFINWLFDENEEFII